MKLLVFVLNKVEALEPILERFSKDGILGATILNSNGMAHTLSEFEGSFLGSLRAILNPERVESRTLFAVLPDEQVALAVKDIELAIGDLSKPDTGIVFTVPVDFTKGIKLD